MTQTTTRVGVTGLEFVGARRDDGTMKRISVLVLACLGVGITSLPRDARALGPVDLEIGARAGAATNPFTGSGQPPNPLGFGLGGRAGVSIFGFYGGLGALYYFGSSGSVGTPFGAVNVSFNTLLYGADLGYSFKLAILTIRPLLGIGNATISTSPSGGSSTSNSGLYLEPGLTALISLGMYFIGADANALILTGVKQIDGSTGTNTAFTAHGQIGVKF
jgi:hypothetical protein